MHSLILITIPEYTCFKFNKIDEGFLKKISIFKIWGKKKKGNELYRPDMSLYEIPFKKKN